MADGTYRYQTGGGQYYYQQQNQPTGINRQLRPSTPGARRPFNDHIPSPSRSPVSRSPASFGMYGHGGHQTQPMINGGQGHQRYGMQQVHNYHSTGHHAHHNQSQHHHGQHSQTSQLTQQYNVPSRTLPHLATQFNQHQTQDGVMESILDDLDGSENQQWKEHVKMFQEYRISGSPHHHARVSAQKGFSNARGDLKSAGEDTIDGEERTRAPVVRKKDKPLWSELDFGGQGLRSLSTALFRYDFLEKLYLNHNRLEKIPPEIGKLKSLVHLDLSHNLLVELPGEIGLLTKLEELLLFDNHLETLPIEFAYMHRLRILGLVGNPINNELGTKIKEEGTKSLINYLREEMSLQTPPPERDWIDLDETSNSSGETFTALTYNVLCQNAATPAYHGYVPERALDWTYRRAIISQELEKYGADIICLQELDAIAYDDFREVLARKNYKSYFAQRTRARTMTGEQARLVDGCGTFWDNKKYICLSSEVLRFSELGMSRDPNIKKSSAYLNRVWPKDHVAIVNLLENRVTGSRLIVANAYVFWDTRFKDVKLIQTAVLMSELNRLANTWTKEPPCDSKKKDLFKFSNADGAEEAIPEPGPSQEYPAGTHIPMIICGDFNSEVDSAVYDLLATGTMGTNHVDFEDRDYGHFSDKGVDHPFNLKSSYGNIGELSFTNHTPDYSGVLDYIWYSSNTLRVKRLLGEVDKEYLRKVPGFPNYHFPSDHLPLVAELSVVKRGGGGKVIEADFSSTKKATEK